MESDVGFVVGFIAGAAIIGERTWGYWMLAGITVTAAAIDVSQGSWLWAIFLALMAWFWVYCARSADQSEAEAA